LIETNTLPLRHPSSVIGDKLKPPQHPTFECGVAAVFIGHRVGAAVSAAAAVSIIVLQLPVRTKLLTNISSQFATTVGSTRRWTVQVLRNA